MDELVMQIMLLKQIRPTIKCCRNSRLFLVPNTKQNIPDEVTKVILSAVTTSNPAPRYTVGEDAATLIDIRRKSLMLNFTI